MPADVTIILPIHNAEPYLEQTARQLEQMSTGRHSIEILAVEDHSSDASAAMLADWVDRFADVKVLTANDYGVSAARNQAIVAAQGEYVWFADADDSWDPAIVEAMLDAARLAGSDIVVCNARKVWADGSPAGDIVDAEDASLLSGADAFVRLLDGRLQGHLWNKLFKRSLLHAATFPATRAHSDMGGLLALLPTASAVQLVPRTLYNYVVHAGSILNSKSYRWDDLTDCLRIAQAASRSAEPSKEGRSALLGFKYRQVVIPVANELVRRDSWEQPTAISAVRVANRKSVRVTELFALLRQGQAKLALQSALVRFVPGSYARLYRRRRTNKWSALDKT